MSEILQYVLTSLITLITTGGIGSIFFIKLQRRLKAAEVKAAEVDVKSNEIENLSHSNDEWIRLYNSCLEEKKAISDKLNDERKLLEEKIEELYHEKEQMLEKHSDCMQESIKKDLYISELNWYRCEVNGCPYRKPPRKFGQNYFPKDALNPIENPDPNVLKDENQFS